MLKKVQSLAPHAMAVFMSVIFLDSLRYKFTNAPETIVIFGKLDGWAGTIGFPGLFLQTGLFSQYVIGSIELVASSLLLIGILPRFRHLQAGGALAGFLVMSGAVNFHLWTPLGIDPNNDGGGLFVAACIVWVSSVLMMTVFRRKELGVLIRRVTAIFAPLPGVQAAPVVTGARPVPVN